jgi:hypothetical protein
MLHDPGESLYPVNLAFAMKVCRFANAELAAHDEWFGFRYVVDCNVHESFDPHCEVPIWDDVDETWLTTSDLLCRLTPENAAICRWPLGRVDRIRRNSLERNQG